LTFEDRPQAKVNLALEVVGRREDGYHELRSVFLRVGLSDRLRIAPGGADGSDTLTVSGLPGAPTRNNLVTLAIEALRVRAEVPLPTLDVSLEKGIPTLAGLGGGSSDCALALRLAQACWGIGLSQAEELEIGFGLGSDVPFFLSGFDAALVEGRGEHVSRLAGIEGEIGILIVTPPISLSTAVVFDTYDQLDPVPDDRQVDALARRMEPGWSADELVQFTREERLVNDLWDAAILLEPALNDVRAGLEVTTRRAWMMSGSGPTLFAFYPSVEDAVLEGASLVAQDHSFLRDALLFAVDAVGPDPAWRFPWA
jgi:4-diphosphocytidyl-2-C-methyl-D-erythritol kinase